MHSPGWRTPRSPQTGWLGAPPRAAFPGSSGTRAGRACRAGASIATASFEVREDLLRQRVVPALVELDLAAQDAAKPARALGRVAHELGDRLAVARDHHLLARLLPVHQFGEPGLRFMQLDLFHSWSV